MHSVEAARAQPVPIQSQDLISLAEIQSAFLATGVPAGELAHRLEWLRPNGRPDTTRVRRTLGLASWKSSNGRFYTNARIDHDLAVRIVRALHLAPRDAGL